MAVLHELLKTVRHGLFEYEHQHYQQDCQSQGRFFHGMFEDFDDDGMFRNSGVIPYAACVCVCVYILMLDIRPACGA